MHPVTSLWISFYQLSSITIACNNLWFNSYSLTLLVLMLASCIPPSHHTVLCKLHYLPFLTNWILLKMFLVCLVSFSFLAVHIADFIFSIMRGGYYGTTSGSLFKNSLFNILKYARAITKVHAAFYSLLALFCATGPGTFVKWSIGSPL